MKKIAIIILICSIILANCQEEEEVTVDTDYSPATIAYTQLRLITDKQTQFKERVKKNVSIEYDNCVNSINTLRCNNIDQWQSVVEELQLQNENSDSAEIPFLKKRKTEKVDSLKKLLEKTSDENGVLAEMTGKIQANQKKLMQYYYDLDQMYKLPKEKVAEFAQMREGPPPSESNEIEEEPAEEEPAEEEQVEKSNAAEQLNADVPDLAKEQLGEAKNAYEQADETIQAQTAANLLKDYVRKISQTLKDMQASFDSRFEDLLERKEIVKSDILKARSMLNNEEDIKAKNAAKIAEMEGYIAACQGKPTNIEKDCEPIRVNASKVLTELDIVEARSTLLYKELSQFLEENYNSANLAAHSEELTSAANNAQHRAEMDYYLEEKKAPEAPRAIQELHPKHHFKENMPKAKSTESGDEQATAVPAF